MAAGCDTLYWSAHARSGPAYDALLLQRQAAEAGGASLPWRVIDGFSLSVLPRGVGRYRVVLDCFEFQLQFTDSKHLPTVYVELRSAFILEVGLEQAFAASVSVVRSVICDSLAEPHVARIDLFADYGGWVITHPDYPGFITHAKRHTVASDSTEYETLRAGKTPFLVRVYRKDLERRQRREPAPLIWGGYTGPVIRVEVQANNAFLRKLGARTFEEVLAVRGDIWRYGTHEFLELREVRPLSDKASWPLREEWRVVQETGLSTFPSSRRVPFVVVAGDRARVMRLLYGCLTSLGALDGLSQFDAVLFRASALLSLVDAEHRRPFAAEVARKRARLPRAVLGRDIDSLPASAGAEKETSSCATEPSQPNTAGGTEE
ncbi:MAG: hypothetical protein M3T56_14345 [Chloroflexota bacterium]|nr:hypothetical protein [Chloroflexota bacterium]